MSVRNTLLVVEDEDSVRLSIAHFFRRRGYRVDEAASCAEAERSFRTTPPDAAIIDFQLPDGDGLQLLSALRALDAAVPMVLLTGHGTIGLAVRAIKEGAEQFLTKPVELEALLLVIERALDHQRHRQRQAADLSREARSAVDPFVGESPALRRLAEQARRVAASSASVLILGETGSGKGVLAAWLHRNGSRAREAFVDLNCAGLAPELLESELFGHEKGAFTGAVGVKPGLFEVAHRGTLFLDEVGDVDPAVQPKLLKVIEERRFRRLGAVRDRQVDVRLVAATHRDLERMVQAERFRGDLYYRISAVPLLVPPLRERSRDVILLARGFLARFAADLDRPGLSLSAGAERALLGHAWPGNVRELRNVLERAALLSAGPQLAAADLWDAPAVQAAGAAPARIALSEAERRHIAAVLDTEQGNVPATATVLGISRSALYEKIRKHRIPLRKPRSGA